MQFTFCTYFTENFKISTHLSFQSFLASCITSPISGYLDCSHIYCSKQYCKHIFSYIFLYFISMGGINRREVCSKSLLEDLKDKVKFSKICVNFHLK